MSDFHVRKHSLLCRLIVRRGIPNESIIYCSSIRRQHPMHLVSSADMLHARKRLPQLKLIVNSVRTAHDVFAFEHLECAHFSLLVFHIALFCHIRLRNYFLPAKSSRRKTQKAIFE